MTHNEKVEVIREKYDLDCLEVSKEHTYLSCDRGLHKDELELLGEEIKSLQEDL